MEGLGQVPGKKYKILYRTSCRTLPKLRGDIQTIVGKINVIMTLGGEGVWGLDANLTVGSKLWIAAYEW